MRDVFALGFPGQGSDWSTTVSVLAQHSSHELAQELGRRTGVENFADIDPADTLHAQPAIYTASMIGSSLLSPERYAATIGHSFGELAALVCAGVFEPSDGLSLAMERGRLGAIAQQNNPGAMVAVMASTLEAVEDARRSCGEGPDAWLEIAVINHPSQVVLSGDPASVNRIVEHFSATSARTLVLPIGGPFHTSAMGWAAIQYEQFARGILPSHPPSTWCSAQAAGCSPPVNRRPMWRNAWAGASSPRLIGPKRSGEPDQRASPPASTADPATRSFGSQNVRG